MCDVYFPLVDLCFLKIWTNAVEIAGVWGWGAGAGVGRPCFSFRSVLWASDANLSKSITRCLLWLLNWVKSTNSVILYLLWGQIIIINYTGLDEHQRTAWSDGQCWSGAPGSGFGKVGSILDVPETWANGSASPHWCARESLMSPERARPWQLGFAMWLPIDRRKRDILRSLVPPTATDESDFPMGEALVWLWMLLDVFSVSCYMKKEAKWAKPLKNEIEKFDSKQPGRTIFMALEGTLTCLHLSN